MNIPNKTSPSDFLSVTLFPITSNDIANDKQNIIGLLVFSQIAVSKANESIAVPLGKKGLIFLFSSCCFFPLAFTVTITIIVNKIATNVKCFGDEINAERILLLITIVVSLKNRK